MHLSLVQEQAIAARMALIVGAKEFDRLFPGVQFSEVDGDILFCFAMNEELAAEMEDKYALRISIVASDILRTDIGTSWYCRASCNKASRKSTRFVRLAAGTVELIVIPEGLLCGDPWRTRRSPPLGEMVPNLSDWRRANRDHMRVPAPCLPVLAQAARRAHC
jgi:hypothetical protein